MSQESDLRDLYLTLEAVRSDTQLASLIGELISSVGSSLHPFGGQQIGEFTIGDLVYQVDLSDRFGRACAYGGHQERDDLELFLGLCDPGSVIWDIGANFGLYAVAAAEKAGPSGAVFAAEPSSRAIALLKQNIERNARGAPIYLFSYAVSDLDGAGIFHDAQETAFSGLSDTGRSPIVAKVHTEVRRLDSLWQETGRCPIDLIKIDVEGHEVDVLLGARQAIAASPQVVIQFEASPKNLDLPRLNRLLSTLHGLQAEGMALWCLEGAKGELLKLPLIEGDLPEYARGNLFMVLQGSEREARLIELAAGFAARRPLVSSKLEKAMASTLRQIGISAKNRLVEHFAWKNSGVDVSKPSVHRAHAVGLGFPPTALADVTSITLMIRITGDGQDVAAAADSAVAFSAGCPASLMMVDARPRGGPIETLPTATAILPPLHVPHRYSRAELAALRAAETSHILLMDADGIVEGSVEEALELWRQKASAGERVAGLAFSFETGGAPALPIQEEIVGGMLVLRHGLLANAPLRDLVRESGPFAGDGVDLDLSLRLWHNGFVICEAPSSICFRTSRKGPRPTYAAADMAKLEERWTGIFFHPSFPELFRTSRLRPPRRS